MSNVTKKRTVAIGLTVFIIFMLIGVVTLQLGENEQIVGTWNMSKVMIGDKEYDPATFLDPTDKSDSSFVIQLYGDHTLIATGSLGTIKGASDGEWEKISKQKYTLTIDKQKREVKMVGDLLFMEIKMEDASAVVVFERKTS